MDRVDARAATTCADASPSGHPKAGAHADAMGEVFEQDISNMCGTQLGLRSEGLPGGMRYAERELRVQVFHAETDLRLRGLK